MPLSLTYRIRRRALPCLVIPLHLATLLGAGCARSDVASEVIVAQVPAQGTLPDASLGPDGRVHLVFASGDDVYYTAATPSGENYSTPVRVNDVAGTSLAGMFRGPELAIGSDASIHVVWYARGRPGDGGLFDQGVMYANSRAGDSFTASRNVSIGAVDGISVGARGSEVAAIWQDGITVQSALSVDGGQTFPPAVALGGLACECCDTAISMETSGPAYVAYRDREQNRRDMYLLELDGSANAARPRLRLDAESWQIDACPMSSVGLARHDETLFAAWEHAGKILLSRVDLTHWTRSPPVTIAAAGKYPVLAANTQTLLVAWKQRKQLHWRTFDLARMQPTGEGSAMAASSSRPAAIATSTGTFVVFP